MMTTRQRAAGLEQNREQLRDWTQIEKIYTYHAVRKSQEKPVRIDGENIGSGCAWVLDVSKRGIIDKIREGYLTSVLKTYPTRKLSCCFASQ
jgi:hypothetical protein